MQRKLLIYTNLGGRWRRCLEVLKHMRRAVSLFKYGLDYIFQCLVNHTNRYRINVFKFLSYT